MLVVSTSMNRVSDAEKGHTTVNGNVGAITSDSGMNDLFGPFVTDADAGHSQRRRSGGKEDRGRSVERRRQVEKKVERTSTFDGMLHAFLSLRWRQNPGRCYTRADFGQKHPGRKEERECWLCPPRFIAAGPAFFKHGRKRGSMAPSQCAGNDRNGSVDAARQKCGKTRPSMPTAPIFLFLPRNKGRFCLQRKRLKVEQFF